MWNCWKPCTSWFCPSWTQVIKVDYRAVLSTLFLKIVTILFLHFFLLGEKLKDSFPTFRLLFLIYLCYIPIYNFYSLLSSYSLPLTSLSPIPSSSLFLQNRIEGDSKIIDSTRQPIESTKLGPYVATETELPNREQACGGSRSFVYGQQLSAFGLLSATLASLSSLSRRWCVVPSPFEA